MRQIPRAADAVHGPAHVAGADVNANPVAGANVDPANGNANANANGAVVGGAGGGVLGGIRNEDVEELLRGDRAERVEQRAVEAAQRALVAAAAAAAAAAAGAPQQQPIGGAGAGAGAAEGWMDRLLHWRRAARGGVAGAGGLVGFARGRAGGAGGGGVDRRGNGLVLALAGIGAGGDGRGQARQEG